MDSQTLLNSLQQWLHPKTKTAFDDLVEPPIPAELFNEEQMERHGVSLALSHPLLQKPLPDMLLQRLSESENILIKSCDMLSENPENSFSPAREWLLDNFYLIQEQMISIRRNLPKGYGKTLPQLGGNLLGIPRVYDIALEIIQHGDGRWDLQNVTRFISAYQTIASLTLGELWAVPITLGIALIENLSAASKRIVADSNDRHLAAIWADRMLEVASSEPKKLVIILADLARSNPSLSSAYVAELARRLQGAALALPLSWVEQHLAEQGVTIEQLVQEENKSQAANQVTVSNSIDSLRRLSEVDWRNFVETMSVVEQTLRLDPTGIYPKMDFGTRDRYRHVVEQLSRKNGQSENDIALRAIQLAKANSNSADSHTREAHVGFYLIGKGLPQLMVAFGMRHHFFQRFANFISRHALLSYVGSITLITIALAYAFTTKLSENDLSALTLISFGVFILVYGSQVSIALVNLAATLLTAPKLLPRMDFSNGIPAEYRTLVVVPVILDSATTIDSTVNALEVRFLGNRDPHLQFMLLTDFKDAKEAHLPEDDALLALARERITHLNEQYAEKNAQDIFFLCHRPRQWNESEMRWIGKERKRGKLTDLNNLLCANDQTPFSLIVGNIDNLTQIKYVITLDSDTQLPREAARQFVGTMTHPLNRPIINTSLNRVTEGYGILQPRVAEALALEGANRYIRLNGNDFGIDPYTRTVSDVYQDVFQEGSFIGKGIYDVSVFQSILGNRFPDNCILSHDLLEGCYLRSGYLSDVPLYEKSPSSYLVDVKRRIRWIRGDWQLTSWLLPKVKKSNGMKERNPLSYLSRFKLFDNLRRSLVPIALMGLFAMSFTVLPANAVWFGLISLLVLLPTLVKTVLDMLAKPTDMSVSQHLTTILQASNRSLDQLILYLACLPHEAWYSLSAIIRTSWRMLISKHHLLEWTVSDLVDKQKDTLVQFLTNMWAAPIAALLSFFVLLTNEKIELLVLALPLLILWFTSPFIAYWISRPFQRRESKLNSEQIRFLRRMARRTWRFFETFITADDHWLPPDNFQETPVIVLARRTSPTNMGLSLLANLTAYDFGYIPMGELLQRTMNALQTMTSLERYRGHLYNWYSTETLAPLPPRYISTVDSGNLAGHLLTLRQGLIVLPEALLLNERYLDGLEDTCDILATKVMKSQPQTLRHFQKLLQDARIAFKADWASALTACSNLYLAAEKIAELIIKIKKPSHKPSEWPTKLLSQSKTLLDEITLFASIPNITPEATLKNIASLQSTDPHAQSIISQAKLRMTQIENAIKQAFSLAQMDMSFLYNEASHLMTIGFNVDAQRADPSSYDLLSSEARLGNFVAIAQGQVKQESWFALGRLLVSSGREPVLISWSGSMFEYLMPLLVMPTYTGTLLDQTYHAAVHKQMTYGKQHNVPWGVSESGYNAVDNQYHYLYRAFGVPELGLKRGLEEDLVIAPYATVMALMITPEAACLNLQKLAQEKVVGKYGFYEAIDYTSSRLPPDSKRAIVRSFMAHHQGMSFLAFSYLLHKQPMQRRFTADPLFQATLLLLQERRPKPTASYLQIPKSPNSGAVSERPEASMRVFHSPNTHTPQVQLLSNGSYHLVLTQAGGGYSRWKDLAVTRWREDSVKDDWGLFSYIRDISTGKFWSTSYQPRRGPVEDFKTIFSESHVEFMRTEERLHFHTEVVVSPEDDIELRRLRIHNRSKTKRTIEFTSYTEIVLAPQAADLSQPAFSNLFVETELLPDQQAILATRRPQNDETNSPWLCHRLNVYDAQHTTFSFETDRARFVGRNRTLEEPLAMLQLGDLSNTVGAVLDPIVAIRCRVTIEPDALVIFDLLTGIAETRAHCVALMEKYRDRHLANRIFGLAWTHGQVLLHHLNISEANAQLYGKIASAIIYLSNSRRADSQVLASNRRGQSGLWRYSISGDLPIVLLHIEDAVNIDLVQQLIQAQAYWRHKGLLVDLVILNEEHMSYRQSLQEEIMSLITSHVTDHTGNIIVRVADQIPAEDRILLQTVARIILSDTRGTLKEQLGRRRITPTVMPALVFTKPTRHLVNPKLPALPTDLPFFNGIGGFHATGNEYIIRLTEGVTTPAPWANVLANPTFGTLVSECGQGYTWIENAHEFRLTPWKGDPLKDSAGEAFYLRDEESGSVWSPTALPCRGQGDYQIRHGFGYSLFEHIQEGIYSELTIFVAEDAPVKFAVLKIRNDSLRQRQLSATGYVEWVLGDLRAKNAMYIVTELSQTGAILAQNHYNTEFGERTAFFDAATLHRDLIARTVTGDRIEFLGRNGALNQPAALKHKRLSGRVGAGLDPCATIQLTFDLTEGSTREIIFTLGAGQNKQDADTLAQRYHGKNAAQSALAATCKYWQQILTGIEVATPDPAVNFLANGWLLYQVLSSRLLGRTGYYQSGGAFGFRDQLQDVMALSHAAPHLFRAHILLCAVHQFEAGDVQHWWHPPSNRGVRTRCSDDYLWLPFAICHYIETTGDMTLLDEAIPFLVGRALNADEESYYELPTLGTEKFSLYVHAVRAIQNGLKFGAHGLPLMGSGDWNDGMNLVGKAGKGESIWLGFFLYSVLKRFAKIAERYGDHAFAITCEEESQTLQQQLESHAWDGKWYRRAYFDDGTPLGSTTNKACQIDSIAQSWSVLSGAAGALRAREAMQSLYQRLVSEPDGLVKLLDPPFNHSIPNPGYIEGYVPGIRENGGQYTHGAIWAAMAFAELGEKDLAWQLLHILNPINHGRNITEIQRYKIEPYVIAGDVYSVAPHIGRGGWSWYTGSAGWLYRLIIDTLLGLQLKAGNQLHFNPLVPHDWNNFSVNYRFGKTVYQIKVARVPGKGSLLLDEKPITENFITLIDDGQVHQVSLTISEEEMT